MRIKHFPSDRSPIRIVCASFFIFLLTSLVAHSAAATGLVCFCHVPGGSPSTLCTSDSGAQHGHRSHGDQPFGCECGDGACLSDPSLGIVEDCQTCPQDCGACPFCGDGSDDDGEDCGEPALPDCGPDMICVGCRCADICVPDGVCNGSETCGTCAVDCGSCPVCGNESVESGEECDGGDCCNGDCTFNTGNSCDDGNACTTGTSCQSGICGSGTPLDCGDGNACTSDSCDSVQGCAHEPVACSDGNLCTTDLCDPASGCLFPTLSCDDADACTDNTCDSGLGCGHSPTNCDDGIACTDDSCLSEQGCLHAPIHENCSDGNLCTDDTCDPGVSGGCEHANNAFSQSCYTGPDGTSGVGECRHGTKTCGGGDFGLCIDEVTPAAETCDGKDNDCNGSADEGFDLGASCTVGVGACRTTGQTVCAPGGAGTVCDASPAPGMTESCDGIDNDCDGLTDEGFDAAADGTADCQDACPNDRFNDEDADGICGDHDNCPHVANAGQADADGDGLGDACDDCLDANANGLCDGEEASLGETTDALPPPVPEPTPGPTVDDPVSPVPSGPFTPTPLGIAAGRNCQLVREAESTESKGSAAAGFLLTAVLLLSLFRGRLKASLFSAIFLIVLFQAPPAHALNVQSLRPSTGHVQGFQVHTSQTLPRHHFAAGLNSNLANHPFEQVPVGTTSRTSGLVDRFVTADFLLSYGLLDRMTVNLDMPVNVYHDIAPTTTSLRDQSGQDPGSFALSAKIRLLDPQTTTPGLGLAVVPFVTVPTGRESLFLEDKSATGGLSLVGDTQLQSNRLYLNLGSRFRQKERIANLSVGHEFLYGAGFQRPLVKKWDLDVIAELFGSTTLSQRFFSEDISSPMEGLVILRKRWLKRRQLVSNVGGGVGLTNGYGAPNYRAILGVSYAWDLQGEKAPEAPAFVSEVIDVNGKIKFKYDSAVISPESYPLLDEVAGTLQKHPEILHVLIEGHTDFRGSDAYNQKLSERRSGSLKQYLTAKGIPPERLSTVGYGEAKPVADNATEEGRSENRRVIFRVTERGDARTARLE